MAKEKFTCEICGKTFKDKSGLAGHMHGKHPEGKASVNEIDERKAEDSQPAGTKAVAKKKQSPLEQLIDEIKLPSVSDGQAEVFDSGVEYGVRSVLVGVRVAQELSAMGVQQAVPIIKMAQEMRESEGQAAKTIAAELAEATMEGNRDLKSAIGQLGSQITSSGPNPMMSTFMSMMQPYLGQTMQGLMQSFGKGKGGSNPMAGMFGGDQNIPGGEQGEPQPGGEQKAQAPASTSSPGVEVHSIDELEEEG